MSLRVGIAYSGSQADRLRSVLAAVGHDVRPLLVGEIASTLGSQWHPDVCLVDADATGADEAFRVLRQAHRHVYTIAVVRLMRDGPVRRAYESGADDVMLATAGAPEVAGRVDAVVRVRRWLRTMGDDFAQEAPESSLRDVAAWNAPEAIVSEDLGGLLEARLVFRPADYVPTLVHAATVTMTAAGRDVEVKVGVGVTQDSLRPLVCKIAPHEAPEGLGPDLVRELANTAAGAIQRASLPDDFTFALGLPVDVLDAGGEHARVWSLCFGIGEMYLWLESTETIGSRVTAGALREGMVLANEVRSPGGGLLLKAGAVMTERTVERLCRLVGPNALVEIVKAA